VGFLMKKSTLNGPTDAIGQKFGFLTAIKQVGTFRGKFGKSTQRRAIWLFHCDCGNSIERVLTFVKKRLRASCGCKREATIESATKTFMNEYSVSAEVRGYEFSIPYEDFKILVNKKCHYCKASPRTRNLSYKNFKPNFNGIDRKSNVIGYTVSNCVPCCTVCNRMKGTLSYEEFMKQITQIHKILKLNEQLFVPSSGKTGDILLELEMVLDKLCDQGLQLGDIHALVHQQILSHRMDAVETYEEDDSRPVFKYGHKDQV
jgi:hypothetical protein